MNKKSESLSRLRETVFAVYGQQGEVWWRNLPHQLEALSSEQQLTLQPPFEDLSFNYVAPVLGPHQEPWVLKCGVPHDEVNAEIHALRHYAGQGAVRLIQADATRGWMLLEQCIPGNSLASHQDERDTVSIAAMVMQCLWRPVEHPDQFISLERWLVGLKQLHENAVLKVLLPETLRDFVLKRLEELLSSQGEQVLLHGDLHHYNILRHEETWLAIDPKGVVGEREFEIGAFLRNPWCVTGKPFDIKWVRHHLDDFIDITGLDWQRAWSWSVIQAVLCAVWFIEDNMQDKVRQMIDFAEALYAQKR